MTCMMCTRCMNVEMAQEMLKCMEDQVDDLIEQIELLNRYIHEDAWKYEDNEERSWQEEAYCLSGALSG